MLTTFDMRNFLWERAAEGAVNIIRCLHEKGIDIGTERGLLLRAAAVHGRLEVVKYLVENGSMSHGEGTSAWVLAASEGHLDVAHYLRNEILNDRVTYPSGMWDIEKSVFLHVEKLHEEQQSL